MEADVLYCCTNSLTHRAMFTNGVVRVFPYIFGLMGRSTANRQLIKVHYFDDYNGTWCLHLLTDTTYAKHANYVDSGYSTDSTGYDSIPIWRLENIISYGSSVSREGL